MDHLTRLDVFIACLAATTPLVAVFLGFHLQNRSDKKKTDQKLELLLIEHPLHSHDECTAYAKPTDGLTVEGVRYPRRNGNR